MTRFTLSVLATHPRFTRLVLAVPALVAASLVSGDAAVAQQQAPQGAWVSASVSTAAPGDAVSFTVAGFGGSAPVAIALLSPSSVALGTADAYYDGIGVLTVKLPMATPVGDHSVLASGIDSSGRPLTASTPLKVALSVAELDVAHAATRRVPVDAIRAVGLITLVGVSLWTLAIRMRRGVVTIR